MYRHLANLKKTEILQRCVKPEYLNVIPIVTNLFCRACFLAFCGVEFVVIMRQRHKS